MYLLSGIVSSDQADKLTPTSLCIIIGIARLTIFDVIMFMSAVVVAASYDQNDSSLDLVQILISLVIGVFFISMIVSCRKKYYDDIVRCMADYEFAESKKDKKIA